LSTAATPSVAAGFRLAARLHRLVGSVWLAWLAILAPALVVVELSVGPDRANRPLGDLGNGEELLVFTEIMRPIAIPLAATLVFAGLLLLAWCVVWHAGTVRWWLNPDTDTTSVTQILAHGLPVWWRFLRLALLALLLQLIVTTSPWLPLLADVEQRFVLPLLICGSVLTAAATCLVWLAAFRGSWLMGQPGRRSAVAAWFRGLRAVMGQPVRSLLPMIFWAVPGLVLLALPVLYGGPAPVLFLLVAWLLAAFCSVALFLSYAPPKPRPERPVSPLEPPGTPYVTTRFPTLLRDE
jgi:hypothetical protein